MYAGQSELYENASSGDTTEDIMFDNISQNPTRSSEQGRPNNAQDKEYYGGLWSNSSRYYTLLASSTTVYFTEIVFKILSDYYAQNVVKFDVLNTNDIFDFRGPSTKWSKDKIVELRSIGIVIW